jgi:hypothetical protein
LAPTVGIAATGFCHPGGIRRVHRQHHQRESKIGKTKVQSCESDRIYGRSGAAIERMNLEPGPRTVVFAGMPVARWVASYVRSAESSLKDRPFMVDLHGGFYSADERRTERVMYGSSSHRSITGWLQVQEKNLSGQNSKLHRPTPRDPALIGISSYFNFSLIILLIDLIGSNSYV